MSRQLDPENQRLSERGLRAHLAGAAAEDSVARHYEKSGWTVLERRWRGEGGEIDLIVRRGAAIVFVEVKQAATIEAAIASLRPKQLARIAAAAEVYCADSPPVEMRIDLAAVDRTAGIEIIENLTLW